MLVLTADEVGGLLDLDALIDALAPAMADVGAGRAPVPNRSGAVVPRVSSPAPVDMPERLFNASSLRICLPGSLADGGVGTGAAIRPDTVRRYVDQAGFVSCRIADIEHMFSRFYVLQTLAAPGPSAARARRTVGSAAVLEKRRLEPETWIASAEAPPPSEPGCRLSPRVCRRTAVAPVAGSTVGPPRSRRPASRRPRPVRPRPPRRRAPAGAS